MATERNYLINGRFLQNLNGWTAENGASYLASDGDDHYGIANLPVGGSVRQDFAVDNARAFTLHVAVKAPSGTLTAGQATFAITDGDGNAVLTGDLAGGAGAWTETNYTIGLGGGTTYEIKFLNVSAAGDIRIDDIWFWFVPVTRAQIAAQVHNKLGRVATERNLVTTPSGTLTEGSYTYAIDAALRNVGAINPETGLPDVRYLNDTSVQNAIDATRREMLEQLQSDYAVEVDTRTGPYQQSLSQKRQAIAEILGGAGGESGSSTGGIVVRKMSYD